MADKAHNSILIYYVFGPNKFVRASRLCFCLASYPGNELYVHELANNFLAYPLQSLKQLLFSLSLSEAVKYITNAVDMSGIA